MEIIVGKTAGFCFGVQNAVNKTKKLLKDNKDIYCLGEIVHNKQVNDELKENGINFVNNIEQASNNVIIRAHGEPKSTYEKAGKLNLKVTDLTCPKVLKIHKIAENFSEDGYYILLIGKKTHPEIIGTISFCGEKSDIIEDEQDIEKSISHIFKSGLKKVLIIVQTTFSMDKFKELTAMIKKELEKTDLKIEVKNTICSATKLRQEETEKISKEVDIMIIIGGKNSSNTNKLYEIAKKNCKDSILIESKEELKTDKIKTNYRIGIMAGASTPIETVNEIINELRNVK